ncbi:hypothetical protein RSAG8_06268, partial [Rhizoctonia solani AG-8 WAC10335]
MRGCVSPHIVRSRVHDFRMSCAYPGHYDWYIEWLLEFKLSASSTGSDLLESL